MAAEQEKVSRALVDARKALVAECRELGWQPLRRRDLLNVDRAEVEAKAGLRVAVQSVEAGWHAGLAVHTVAPLRDLHDDAMAILDLAQRLGWGIGGFDAAHEEDTDLHWGYLTVVPLTVPERRPRLSGRPQELDDDVVSEILVAHWGGATPYAIAKDFNARGVPAARAGSCWYPSTINRVLSSRAAQRIKEEAENMPDHFFTTSGPAARGQGGRDA